MTGGELFEVSMKLKLALLPVLCALLMGLVGCGMGVQAPTSSGSLAQIAVKGHLRGGHLYATSTTANSGAWADTLLTKYLN